MTRPEFESKLITDSIVLGVLHELYEQERHIEWDKFDFHPDPHQHASVGFSMSPEQGDQLYMLLRFARPATVIEFATSLGFSTIFLAAALREAGGGTVYSTELVPEKISEARRNIERAGLSDYVVLLEGDARQTLSAVPDDIDFAVIDGWAPEVSLEVLQTIEPKIRSGGLIYNENLDDVLIEYTRRSGSGYRSLTLPSGSAYKPAGELILRI